MRLNLTIPGREVNDGMLEALKDFLVQHEYAGEYRISIETKDQSATELPVSHTRSSRHRSTAEAVAPKARITVSARRTKENSSPRNSQFNMEDAEVASKSGKFKFKKR